jgi:hypothetical protein
VTAGVVREGSSKGVKETFFLIIVADLCFHRVITRREGEGEGASGVRSETVEVGKGVRDSKMSARSRASFSTARQ